MSEVNEKITKSYKCILFIGQFLLKVDDLESLSDSLPGILSRIGVNDEDKRIKIIDSFRALVDDFKEVKAANHKNIELVTRTTRNFIRTLLAFFGFLTTVTSIKNLIINLSQKKLDSSVSLDSLKNIGLVSTSFGLLLSSVPLTDAVLSKLLPFINTKTLATFLTSLAAFQIYPKAYSRDLLSIYLFVYGAESVQTYLTQKGLLKSWKNYKITDLVTKSWFLIPLTLSQLYPTYYSHPEYTPTFVKKVFDSLFYDLYNSKPAWFEVDSAAFENTTAMIKNVTFFGDKNITNIMENDYFARIKNLQPSPIYTEKILSFINPNQMNHLKLLLRYAPSKFLKLMLYITPFFLLKALITKRIKFQDLKTKWKSYIATVLKESSKLSLFGILTASTAHFLTAHSVNNLQATKIDPQRLVGFIAGLWGLLYRDTASRPLLSYILRVTLLSVWRRQAHIHPVLDQYNLELVLNALGITTLVGFRDTGLGDFITPKRFNSFANWISQGGEDHV